MEAQEDTSTLRMGGPRRERVRLLREGDLVDGRLRIEDDLGEGGMGVVVAARHVDLGVRYAIKYLRPEVCRRPDLVARFGWEGRATREIRSQHAVRVTETGVLDGGIPYLVMELLDGMDLEALLRKRGAPLPIAEAADYVLQACDALAELHAKGIVHRDLKPRNLFVTRHADGTPLLKVIDFGISSGGELDLAQTPPGRVDVMGSPGYMAPEQAANFEAADARADIWSLGAILYLLVTGRRTDDRDSQAAHRDLPASLAAIIARCLESDRERRIQSVTELAAALMPYAVEPAPALCACA